MTGDVDGEKSGNISAGSCAKASLLITAVGEARNTNLVIPAKAGIVRP
jgi:hypothetical protein